MSPPLIRHLFAAVCALLIFASDHLKADVPTVLGELIIEPPTTECLGFEWRLEGDASRNAGASVQYREKGTTPWHEALPLYRTGGNITHPMGKGGDHRGPHGNMPYTVPDALNGSIIGLKPATTYQIQITATDPDGIENFSTQTLELTTRAEPTLPVGGEVRHVYPPDHKGEKQQPAFDSIMHAVNGFNPIWDNFQTIHPDAATPGTVIKLHAGLYKIDRHNYREPAFQLWQNGTYFLCANGTPEKPIAIIAAGDGEVIIDGDGNHNLFNIRSADHLYFEGLTLRNTEIAFFAGYQGERGGGAKGLVVKNCWIEGVAYGVLAQDGRSTDFYIADNVFIGRNPSDRFNPESGGAWGRTQSGYAVNLSGSGHTITHNHVANFWDGINVFTNALADPAYGQQARAIDITDNIIFNSSDDFIETDGGYANIRVLRNLCLNDMGYVISTQPNYAGPTYILRNIFWNAAGGVSTLKPDGNAPVLIFQHNTASLHFTAPNTGQLDLRNNLFLGPPSHTESRPRHLLGLDRLNPDRTHHIDHNAYRTGLPGQPFRFNSLAFSTLAEFTAATGFETHGLTVPDLSGLTRAPEPPNAHSNKEPLVWPADLDLTPAPGSPFIDAGVRIPGVNDGFAGKAPDLGALESGRPYPHFGPRPTALRTRLQAYLDPYRTPAP